MAEAYFAFQGYLHTKRIILKLTSVQNIAENRRIISAEEKGSVHVMGPSYSFHIDPDTVIFFTMAIEVCDAPIF